MSATIRKTADGGYSVRTPGGIHSKNTSKKNAEAQVRLLNAVDRGWKHKGIGKK